MRTSPTSRSNLMERAASAPAIKSPAASAPRVRLSIMFIFMLISVFNVWMQPSITGGDRAARSILSSATALNSFYNCDGIGKSSSAPRAIAADHGVKIYDEARLDRRRIDVLCGIRNGFGADARTESTASAARSIGGPGGAVPRCVARAGVDLRRESRASHGYEYLGAAEPDATWHGAAGRRATTGLRCQLRGARPFSGCAQSARLADRLDYRTWHGFFKRSERRDGCGAKTARAGAGGGQSEEHAAAGGQHGNSERAANHRDSAREPAGGVCTRIQQIGRA